MKDTDLKFLSFCDITPIRRGIELFCKEPVSGCPILEMNKWGVFKYNMRVLPNAPAFTVQIIAPDVMDCQISQHMYGFVSNICRQCIAKRKQNAL